MLGYQDGANEQIGVSYLEIVEFLMEHGGNVDNDLEELWRRIVFYICVSNTDDHLRNHGFILTRNGWVLSPAYDINPVEFGGGLSLNISDTLNVVKDWQKYADKYQISKSEQDRIQKAFIVTK